MLSNRFQFANLENIKETIVRRRCFRIIKIFDVGDFQLWGVCELSLELACGIAITLGMVYYLRKSRTQYARDEPRDDQIDHIHVEHRCDTNASRLSSVSVNRQYPVRLPNYVSVLSLLLFLMHLIVV